MIGVEMRLMLRRRRVWLCWALLCALPTLVAVLLATTRLAPPPGQGGAFLSAVVSNGQLFPAAALALVLPVFLPITVAVVAGDAVAGEAATVAAGCSMRWSASGSAASTGDPCAPTRSGCASGSASPRPCCAPLSCSFSTSRPTASTHAASARSGTCSSP